MPYSNQKMPTLEDVKTLMASVLFLDITLHHFETIPNLGCGCWSLIIRHEELLIRFFWDERDHLLLAHETDFNPKMKRFIWHPTVIPKVDVDEVREPFRYIEEFLKKRFSP